MDQMTAAGQSDTALGALQATASKTWKLIRPVRAGSDLQAADSAQLWQHVHDALSSVGQGVVELPEKRTLLVDWVRQGLHLPR